MIFEEILGNEKVNLEETPILKALKGRLNIEWRNKNTG